MHTRMLMVGRNMQNILLVTISPKNNKNVEIELKRFFVESDYCEYTSPLDPFKYAPDEM